MPLNGLRSLHPKLEDYVNLEVIVIGMDAPSPHSPPTPPPPLKKPKIMQKLGRAIVYFFFSFHPEAAQKKGVFFVKK